MAQSQRGSGSSTAKSSGSGSTSKSSASGSETQKSKGRGAATSSGESRSDAPDMPSASQVQEQAGQFVTAAKEQATEQLSTQKERVAGTLGTLAEAMHQAGSNMRDQDERMMAQYVESAADQVEQIAGMLRNQDVTQLLQSATEFGRRQPVPFLVASFALGFAATRFLRSSSQSQGSASWSERSRGAWSSGSAFDASGYGAYSSDYVSSGGGMGSGYGRGMQSGQGRGASLSGSTGVGDTVLGSEWSGESGYGSEPEGR